jgi:hypothetical protein
MQLSTLLCIYQKFTIDHFKHMTGNEISTLEVELNRQVSLPLGCLLKL